MNQTEIQRLAAAIHALRPDWRSDSLRTFVAEKLAHYAWRDATLALAFVATERESRTPARVLEDGPWWNATRAATEERTPSPPPFDRAARARALAQRTPSDDVDLRALTTPAAGTGQENPHG